MAAIRLNVWNTNPTVVLRSTASSDSPSVAISVPSTVTVPSVGTSNAPIMFINVDFPDPDGPMIATNSPSAIAIDDPRSARTVVSPSWYSFSTSWSSINAILPSTNGTDKKLAVLPRAVAEVKNIKISCPTS
jgi:hypothetical protein